MIQTAMTYLGVPFVYGGSTRAGLDSVNLVRLCYERATKKRLPAQLLEIVRTLDLKMLDEARLGDILVFDVLGIASELGIYLGNHLAVVSSPDTVNGVELVSLSSPTFRSRLRGAFDPMALNELILIEYSASDSAMVYLGTLIDSGLVIYPKTSQIMANTQIRIVTQAKVEFDGEILVFQGSYPDRYRILHRMPLHLDRGNTQLSPELTLTHPGAHGVLIRDVVGNVRTMLSLQVLNP